MNNIKTATVVILSVIGSFTSANAADLFQIHKLALENDPVYEIGLYEKQASSEVYQQAQALLLPQVTFDISAANIDQDIISADNTVFASGKTSYSEDEYTLAITQSVIDPAKWAGLKKADYEVKRLAVELESLRQDLALRVVDQYFAVLAANSGLEYVRAEKKSVGTQLEHSQAKYDKGLIRHTELQDSQARYLQVHAREIEITNRLNDALLGLSEIIGQLPDSLSMVVDSIEFARPDPRDPGEWVQLALQQNPEILAKEFAVDEAKQELKQQKAGHWPVVNFGAESNYRDTGGTLFGGGSEVRTTEFSLTLSVPIFSGGAVISRVKQAAERHSKAIVELQLAKRQVERDTRAAYDGILTAIAKAESLKKLVEANEALVQSKSAAFDNGLLPILDVLDAERDLFYARSEYVLSRHQYILELIRLKRAAGVLGSDDIKEISGRMLTDKSSLSLSNATRASYIPVPN